MFTHDAKNIITIGAFSATLDDFLLLEPSYHLPDGAYWQFYVPGVKHLIGYGLYQRDDGPSWSDGDVFLSNETAYSTMQPDTTPNVPGFEAALFAVFGGDVLAINSLYSGWPLFKNTLEAEQWMTADFLLTDSYVKYEFTTEIYTAIVAAARANYIPMALQGRPGIMPLNILDVVRAIVVPDLQNKTDSLLIGLSDATPQVIVPVPSTSDSCTVQIGTETAALVLPITIKSGDTVPVNPTESTPTLVMT